MNRKRVNLTIEENWLKIAKKYAIDNNTSVSRVFEVALKNMLRVEEDKKITVEELDSKIKKLSDRLEKKTEDILSSINELKDNING
jgi:D-hexose-6-phosphate mutarotase